MSRRNNRKTMSPYDYRTMLKEVTEQVLEKAIIGKGDKPVYDEPQSFFLNPYDFFGSSAGQWRERPTNISFETLRVVAERNPVIAAIINTRINQIASFSQPARLSDVTGNKTVGYQIVHKQKDKKLSPGEEKFILELEDYIWDCGDVHRKSIYDRDNFDTWLRKTVRDSLTFDAAVTELIPTRKDSVAEFHAIDAATIRMATAKQEMESEDETMFVQVLNGQRVVQYSADEIMYGIRNPSTSIRQFGYGISEIEMMVNIITSIFNAITHNANMFRSGAKGILNVRPTSSGGGANREQFEAFKRALEVMVTGASNSWRLPVIQSEQAQFVTFGNTNREMELRHYIDFLIKVATAVYQIEPAEINFAMQAGGGNGSSMFESNQESKLKYSKDKGLKPLLNAHARWINQFIIKRIAPEFYFTWVGIDTRDEKDNVELRIREATNYKTIDETRKDAGLDELGEEKGGNLILNPQYTQFLQQQRMMEMQEQQMGQGQEEEPPQESEEDQNPEEEQPTESQEGKEEPVNNQEEQPPKDEKQTGEEERPEIQQAHADYEKAMSKKPKEPSYEDKMRSLADEIVRRHEKPKEEIKKSFAPPVKYLTITMED